ncbi:hypothetical protein [Flavobacterium gilvum]|uniref:DUF2946 domain-containing protein n=1 Tax=Flavobacterium gilvum TaxID=1492737 RepID=A0AAC9I443_9FLAO|nr:hypothetical protein [Flavobacterium gilvum]AOW08508.1 hypothetical protein EM308_02785 [Flavobacterium gilvum]KFC58225.1 hypothetical protein FEM08_29950 [Flavobacterium gilvum]
MKKRQVILNSFLALAILFAMLFQSVHSYEHLAQQLSEKKCHHTYSSKHEITHQHHNFDHCYVCDFKISNFISAEIASYEFQEVIIPFGCTFSKSKQITEFFKGSLFALRAPPFFID